MLGKTVYPYEYMDGWERFTETLLLINEKFYNSLTMERITDADYKHGKRVWEDFVLQKPFQYHDLYV